MKKNISTLLFLLCVLLSVGAQEINTKVFDVINLDYKGLENVKKWHAEGKDKEAMNALLNYYRLRNNVVHPDLDMKTLSISKEEQKMADEALEHKFFAHKGYQPSYFYGKDIDWTYWPVKDNELRWQLHRHKWFVPMGKAYRISGNEKYAKEWIYQFTDWIKKNPYPGEQTGRKTIGSVDDYEKPGDDNARYAWRPLEVSHRIQDQGAQFMLFNKSEYFTPEFLSDFLVNYQKHSNHIMNNFSKQGNHLLFEAQRILFAGVFFPEFKEAAKWRKAGIDILNKQIDVQVYPDGVQFELCPHYHLATIGIFFKALDLAKSNGFENEFPASFIATIHKMIEAEYNLSFPDYSNPLFSDAKMNGKKGMMSSYKTWSEVYPNDEQIIYFATEGRKGKQPAYLSKGFLNSGFFTFRNGWDKNATAMIVKAGPPAFWHNQPDNGTFEMWTKGRNFFPDAGAYVYAGDEEVMKWRNWFRQTKVHKTITLNDKDIEKTDSKTLLWEVNKPTEILVTENESYKELKHRRSVFFVDKKFFVIVDEAIGDAQGTVGLHYQLCDGPVTVSKELMGAYTTFGDGNNVLITTVGDNKTSLIEEEGWVSRDYRKKVERKAYVLNAEKKDATPVRYITVIYPTEDATKAPEIKASFGKKAFDEKGLDVDVKIGKEKYKLGYNL